MGSSLEASAWGREGEGEGKASVGRWGEELVFHFLTTQVAAATAAAVSAAGNGQEMGVQAAVTEPGGERWLAGCEVVWVNQAEESGLPYDLIVR